MICWWIDDTVFVNKRLIIDFVKEKCIYETNRNWENESFELLYEYWGI